MDTSAKYNKSELGEKNAMKNRCTTYKSQYLLLLKSTDIKLLCQIAVNF